MLTVIHLVATTGHVAGGGRLVRGDLIDRALDLARVLAVLLPEEPETLGLLALLELTDARSAARVDGAGDLVLLEDQDRSLWSQPRIAEGLALIDKAMRHRRPGPYQVQAAIAALHARAPRAARFP